MPQSNPPIVRNNLLHLRDSSVRVGTTEWFNWLENNTKFKYQGSDGHFLARCEKRRNSCFYWYAYRRQEGKLYKEYLGKQENLSVDLLRQVSEILATAPEEEISSREPLPNSASRIDNSFLPRSKVNAPELPKHLVSRTRLIKQIHTSLTLIYAPSGFGKSTLINEWKQNCGFPVAWLVLDKNDNQPIRFWQSILMALQICDPKIGQGLLKKLQISASPIQNNQIVSSLKYDLEPYPQIGLVLDDFHHIHNSQIIDSLQAWLESLPPNLQLVLSGHIKPALSLNKLRASDQVTEMSTNDLRFSLDEGVLYLSMYTPTPPVALDDLKKLASHTEGWAAGLTLTALALSNHTNRRQFVDTFSGAHMYFRNYFMETILNRLPIEIQSFLLRTSIIKHFTASLCDALTGQSNSEEILGYLWKENVFVVKQKEKGLYRYHDLFGEMLYDRLKTQYPEEISVLHRKAAKWYSDHFAPTDAISHLISAKAWEEAAALIEETALRELDYFGEDSRLLRWLQELPESVVQQHKTLLFVYLQLANVGLPKRKIQTFISLIEENITRKPVIQRTQGEKDVLDIIQQIRETWAKGHTFTPPHSTGKRSEMSWQLLNNLHLVKVPNAKISNKLEGKIYQYYELGKKYKNLFVISMAGGGYARRSAINGHLNRSEKVARQVIQQALFLRGSLPETASIPLVALSLVHFERFELDKAADFLSRASEVDPNPTSTNLPVVSGILRSKIQLAKGEDEEALATIQSIQELHTRRPSGYWNNADLIAYEALICARTAHIEDAEQLLEQLGSVGEHPVADMVRAGILLEKEEYPAAEQILQSLISTYPNSFHEEPTINAVVMLTLAYFYQNNINSAHRCIKEAVQLAENERWFRPFVDYGGQIRPMLQVLLKINQLPLSTQKFIHDLLKVISAQTSGQQILPEEELDNLCCAASITPRELNVLQQLGEGLSNQEIANGLYISKSTVKTHLGNIYEKLGVHNRVQAITQAKVLGLI
jgi:LuxR family maltose regulon positive regulatory protein